MESDESIKSKSKYLSIWNKLRILKMFYKMKATKSSISNELLILYSTISMIINENKKNYEANFDSLEVEWDRKRIKLKLIQNILVTILRMNKDFWLIRTSRCI